MKKMDKLVVKSVIAVILAIAITAGYYFFKRNTQLTPVGGDSIESAVQISRDDTIKFNVWIEKNERIQGIYVYWDDDEANKQKLDKGLFFAKGEIDVPNISGVHKLTIQKLLIKYTYYYDVK